MSTKTTAIDLTSYMWRVTKANRWGLRLTVYTAPGLAADLRMRFLGMGVRGRVKGLSAVRFRAKNDIERALELLGAPAGLVVAVRDFHGGDEQAMRRVLYYDGTVPKEGR
jgi:hypothetical protein